MIKSLSGSITNIHPILYVLFFTKNSMMYDGLRLSMVLFSAPTNRNNRTSFIQFPPNISIFTIWIRSKCVERHRSYNYWRKVYKLCTDAPSYWNQQSWTVSTPKLSNSSSSVAQKVHVRCRSLRHTNQSNNDISQFVLLLDHQ